MRQMERVLTLSSLEKHVAALASVYNVGRWTFELSCVNILNSKHPKDCHMEGCLRALNSLREEGGVSRWEGQ